MDAVAEVLKPRDDGGTGHLNTGRRIALQLKAGQGDHLGDEVPLKVHVRTLRYWLASQDPFAIVFCHVPSRRLAYRWVDDELMAELGTRDPTWFTKDSITIRVPWERVLSSDRLGDFDREARRVVFHRHRLLAPGTYERLAQEARTVMGEVLRTAQEAGFVSVVNQLTDVDERVRNATYVVALAGRMRAGKSTLFNALVRRDVSPVARRPTTAVPVLAIAGASDAAHVTFQDGTTSAIPASSNALSEYATQDSNPDNKKGVRIVTVRLVSERLERGIAILDAPGLFDPSEDIRNVTARALAQSNAVLFVMDVSSARTGGFAVEAHVLEELKRVLDHSDRVFLVLNKADELQDADREDVLATLGHALERDGLGSRLAGKPLFVSAQRAWEWVEGNKDSEWPLAALEAQIWDFLLRTNSTGVARLEMAVRDSRAAVDDSLKFTAWRRSTSEQAQALRERLDGARKAISELKTFCQSAQASARSSAGQRLRDAMAAIPTRMGDAMRAAQAVPKKEEIAREINGHLSRMFADAWSAAQRELELHGHEVSERLEAALDQVRLGHEASQHPALFAPSFLLPPVSLLAPEAFGFGALGGLATLIVAPAWALAAAVASFLFGAWCGHEQQLSREIAKIEGKIRDHLRGLKTPVRDFVRGIESGYERLERHVVDRWAVFEKDVLGQLGAVGIPLAPVEREQLEALEARLSAARTRLSLVADEIRWSPGLGTLTPVQSNDPAA
jgi:GTP-binding protein EngB required for normal cell division